ncbi:hypothetical protein WJX81_003076 [Elliptochloris bilobata]|uniref:SGNH hydrolase-type esterase domain-containing protein n=1 Tax=Elliptochloris bilobata TaxID=381761 RepID=A0AAW1RMH8_9CHLO
MTYWSAYQQRLAKEVSQADNAQGFDVAFYGDSILEHWLGTSQGTNWRGSAIYVSQYERLFGNASDFTSKVLAIAGDDLANLWWRVGQGGEWPKVHLPKLAVLMIGTNDLSDADCLETEDALLGAVPGILARMNGVLVAISNAPHIAIVGILPRGAAFWKSEQKWPWPNRYTNAIGYVNQGFAVRVAPYLFFSHAKP